MTQTLVRKNYKLLGAVAGAGSVFTAGNTVGASSAGSGTTAISTFTTSAPGSGPTTCA